MWVRNPPTPLNWILDFGQAKTARREAMGLMRTRIGEGAGSRWRVFLVRISQVAHSGVTTRVPDFLALGAGFRRAERGPERPCLRRFQGNSEVARRGWRYRSPTPGAHPATAADRHAGSDRLTRLPARPSRTVPPRTTRDRVRVVYSEPDNACQKWRCPGWGRGQQKLATP